jgi:imidazolonepropionase-like amidohydrolase
MPSNESLAILGATIIDGNGGTPIQEGVLLIEAGRISAVGDAATPVPSNARRIEAQGKWVMPGIMDANVHLFFTITPDLLVRYENQYEAVIAESAQVALKSGVTTVFDTWGPRAALTSVRDAINQGRTPGSRIYFAGNIIGLGGPTSDDFFATARTVLRKSEAAAIDARWEQGVGPDLLWMTPREIRARVREYLSNGKQDFVKYAGSGHTHMQFISFTAEVQRLIVEEGHRAGMTVQAHTTSPETLRMEIEAGADLLQHGDVTGPVLMPEETLALIAERQIPCAALFTTRRFLAWSEAQGRDPMRTFHRIKDENDRRLIAAGAQLLLTTDSGVLPPDASENPMFGSSVSADDPPTTMGEAHCYWLKAAIELGMRPMAALQAATRNVARAYHVDRELGTLEKGKIADVLILERNPLDNPDHYRSISTVVKEGRLVDRSALPTQSVLTAHGSNA